MTWNGQERRKRPVGMARREIDRLQANETLVNARIATIDARDSMQDAHDAIQSANQTITSQETTIRRLTLQLEQKERQLAGLRQLIRDHEAKAMRSRSVASA